MRTRSTFVVVHPERLGAGCPCEEHHLPPDVDSRNLPEREADTVDNITREMDAVAIGYDSGEATAAEVSNKGSEENGPQKKGFQKKGFEKTGSRREVLDRNGAVTKPSSDDAAFAERIGVIFSAMYNTFMDADVLETIRDVACRLASSASSPDDSAATDIGKLVRFADDRSRERLRRILTRYTDDSLQDTRFAARVRGKRSSYIAKFVPENATISARTLGLASGRLAECSGAYAETRSDCESELPYTVPCGLLGGLCSAVGSA